MIMLEDIDKGDLTEQINLFESKLEQIKAKAQSVLERARNLESHSEKLPEIIEKFWGITNKFESGQYKNMIVGELQKNYVKINEMSARLG